MKKAFTLLELIVSIGLSALILAGLGAVFAGTLTVWRKVQDSTSALKEGRLAMQWVTKDIREGAIIAVGANYINLNTANYTKSGNNLMRGPDIVAQGITGLNFTYYNKEGKEEDNISKINFVSVLLDVEIGGHKLSLRNAANLRNFKPDER